MILISDKSTPAIVYMPKGLDADTYTLEITRNGVTVLTQQIDSTSTYRNYVMVNLELSALPDGEYEVKLLTDADTAYECLMRIGSNEQNKKLYDVDIEQNIFYEG